MNCEILMEEKKYGCLYPLRLKPELDNHATKDPVVLRGFRALVNRLLPIIQMEGETSRGHPSKLSLESWAA